MRCIACNCILTPKEATTKFKETEYSPGPFTELCLACVRQITDDVETIEGHGEDEDLFDEDGNPLDEDE